MSGCEDVSVADAIPLTQRTGRKEGVVVLVSLHLNIGFK